MRIELLKEEFTNVSEEYFKFQNKLFEMFEEDSIMQCLLSNLIDLNKNYQKCITRIYMAGYTVDEVLKGE